MCRAASSAAGLQSLVLVFDAVMLFVARLQTTQYIDRVLHRRLRDVDFLEASCQRVILLEDPAIFIVGSRADAPQLAIVERRLDQVGSIHHAAGRRTGSDHRMNLVDEKNGSRLLLDLG